MKWLVMVVCLFACAAEAAPGLLVSLVTPAPEFPEQMLQARHTGKVRVLMVVNAHGAVVEVQVIESSHPALTEAAQQALGRWQFRPWLGTVDAPARIAFTLPVIFGSHGLASFNDEINIGLGNIRCAYLNYEVQAQMRQFPNASLTQIDLFWYTGQFLHSSYAASQHSEAERRYMLKKLEAAIPRIIRSCRRNPEHRYGDYLPVSIKGMLVGVAEPQEGL